jgi:hypothetical protein|tara:strand:+ start:798 stop:956 length:159 start_codon:yes stop_codon:yes gene_type:complete
MTFAGIRFARNRKGIAATSDWIAAGLMLLSGVGMCILAAIYSIITTLNTYLF